MTTLVRFRKRLRMNGEFERRIKTIALVPPLSPTRRRHLRLTSGSY
jgi:hypothetical protein